MDIQKELAKIFKGELEADEQTREFYSHDASLFELKPDVVGYPKDVNDLKAVIRFVNDHKKDNPNLSITPRSRGTDMSGGAIGDSIVLDVSKHMTTLLKVDDKKATVQPGMMYKDFEVETLKHGSLMPSYPASRDMASVGGRPILDAFVMLPFSTLKKSQPDDTWRKPHDKNGQVFEEHGARL